MRRATRCAGQRPYLVPNGYIGTLSLCLGGPSRWRPPQVAPVARQGGGARLAARAAARRAARRPARAQMAGWPAICNLRLTAGWLAGWLAEIFFTQDQNPAQAATLWDPWAYELLHHLGATTLAACVSRKLTGMEGAPKRSRSRPHSTHTDYA